MMTAEQPPRKQGRKGGKSINFPVIFIKKKKKAIIKA